MRALLDTVIVPVSGAPRVPLRRAKGSRRAGARREKADEVKPPSEPVYSHVLQITFNWNKIIL